MDLLSVKFDVDSDTLNKAFSNSSRTRSYLKHLKSVYESFHIDSPEASICLFKEPPLEEILNLKSKKVGKGVKYLVVIGIGGSNLASKAVYDALRGYTDLIEPGRFPKALFVDSYNHSYLSKLSSFLKDKIKNDEALFVVISKSGATLETKENFKYLKETLSIPDDRFVVVTSEGSLFGREAENLGISVLYTPKRVGGRFSAFSAAHLFPLSVLGFNVGAFIEGGREILESFLEAEFEENAVEQSALLSFFFADSGRNIHVNYFFRDEFESLGKWVRQLTAESLGKAGKGITPLSVVAHADNHSILQLLMGTPKDKYTEFINTENVPAKENRLEGAIYKAVKSEYMKRSFPFSEIILKGLGLKSLGAFMQFKMLETMLLGNLMGINAFNQPDIEGYKKEARALLSKMPVV